MRELGACCGDHTGALVASPNLVVRVLLPFPVQEMHPAALPAAESA